MKFPSRRHRVSSIAYPTPGQPPKDRACQTHGEPMSSVPAPPPAAGGRVTPGGPPRVLVVGATGSIGRLVTASAARHGLRVRGLVRELNRARAVLPDIE